LDALGLVKGGGVEPNAIIFSQNVSKHKIKICAVYMFHFIVHIAVAILFCCIAIILCLNIFLEKYDTPNDFRIHQIEHLEGSTNWIRYPTILESFSFIQLIDTFRKSFYFATAHPILSFNQGPSLVKATYVCIFPIKGETLLDILHPRTEYIKTSKGYEINLKNSQPITIKLHDSQCLILPKYWLFELHDQDNVKCIEIFRPFHYIVSKI
jgi:hypothetical protein